jgi:hypothetical protein
MEWVGCEVVDANANGGEILEGQIEEENSLIAYRAVRSASLQTRQCCTITAYLQLHEELTTCKTYNV